MFLFNNENEWFFKCKLWETFIPYRNIPVGLNLFLSGHHEEKDTRGCNNNCTQLSMILELRN